MVLGKLVIRGGLNVGGGVVSCGDDIDTVADVAGRATGDVGVGEAAPA